jgi:hypothetical protein
MTNIVVNPDLMLHSLPQTNPIIEQEIETIFEDVLSDKIKDLPIPELLESSKAAIDKCNINQVEISFIAVSFTSYSSSQINSDGEVLCSEEKFEFSMFAMFGMVNNFGSEDALDGLMELLDKISELSPMFKKLMDLIKGIINSEALPLKGLKENNIKDIFFKPFKLLPAPNKEIENIFLDEIGNNLTDKQKALIAAIIAKYDPNNFSLEDRISMMAELRAAGIPPCLELRAILHREGFKAPGVKDISADKNEFRHEHTEKLKKRLLKKIHELKDIFKKEELLAIFDEKNDDINEVDLVEEELESESIYEKVNEGAENLELEEFVA